MKRNRSIALILSAPIIGAFGLHKFYLGEIAWGLIYLFTLGLWGCFTHLFDFLYLLIISERDFQRKYNGVVFIE